MQHGFDFHQSISFAWNINNVSHIIHQKMSNFKIYQFSIRIRRNERDYFSHIVLCTTCILCQVVSTVLSFFLFEKKKIPTTINNWGWGIVFSEYINTNMHICTQGKIGFNCSISQIFMTLFIHKIEFWVSIFVYIPNACKTFSLHLSLRLYKMEKNTLISVIFFCQQKKNQIKTLSCDMKMAWIAQQI